MLENIKLVLGITDTSKDGLIQYYINAVVKKILAYTNRIELPPALESVVEEIVINKMKASTSGIDTSGTVKREKIGDYEIEYNSSSNSESSSNELSPYMVILNKFVVKMVKTY
jgi:hypothetical protein